MAETPARSPKLERIWEIIENDIPPLEPQIQAILLQLDSEAQDKEP